MAHDVREIGNAILSIAELKGFTPTNLTLNKIVYFAHAWYLALYSKPLVDSPFEAWQHGPVHPQLYRQLKKFKDKPIGNRLTRVDMKTGDDIPYEVQLPDHEMDHIEKITEFYGARSATWLREISHEPGSPWDQIWNLSKTQSVPGMLIPDFLSEQYYREKLKRRA